MDEELDQEMVDIENLVLDIFKVLHKEKMTIALGALASCQSIIIGRCYNVPDSVNHAFFEDYVSKMKTIADSYGLKEFKEE